MSQRARADSSPRLVAPPSPCGAFQGWSARPLSNLNSSAAPQICWPCFGKQPYRLLMPGMGSFECICMQSARHMEWRNFFFVKKKRTCWLHMVSHLWLNYKRSIEQIHLFIDLQHHSNPLIKKQNGEVCIRKHWSSSLRLHDKIHWGFDVQHVFYTIENRSPNYSGIKWTETLGNQWAS